MNMFLFLNTALINSNNQPNIINSAVLTAAVFAAIVTSVTNLIICIANGQRLKKIEKQKQQNEIDKYRYTSITVVKSVISNDKQKPSIDA